MFTHLSSPSRQIGFWIAVALVMGNMIGSGIFLLPASLATYGGIGLLGWIVSAAGSVALAVVFARLARFDPAAGGPYAYTRHSFGDLAAFLVAWGYWLSVCCGNAAIAFAFVGYLEPLGALPGLSWLPGMVKTPHTAALLAAGSIWLLTAVNIRGIRTAGQLQVVTTVLKVLPLVLIGAAGFMRFHTAPYAIAAIGPRDFAGKLAATAAMTFWAFGGLESATIPADSIANPEKTIPRATIVGTLLAAGIYIISTVGVMNLVPAGDLATSTAPFADAARAFVGERAALFVGIGAAIACFGALNGWILIAGQVPRAIAMDRLFPQIFARLTPRETPAIGLIISSAITTVLVVLNASRDLVGLFTFVLLLGTLNALVPYAFSSLAVLLLRREDGARLPVTRGLVIVAALAFVYSLFAIGGAGADVVYWGFLLLLMGLPVYVLIKGDGGLFHRNGP